MKLDFEIGDKIITPFGAIFIVTALNPKLHGLYLKGSSSQVLRRGVEYCITIPNLCKKVETYNHPYTKLFK